MTSAQISAINALWDICRAVPVRTMVRTGVVLLKAPAAGTGRRCGHYNWCIVTPTGGELWFPTRPTAVEMQRAARCTEVTP